MKIGIIGGSFDPIHNGHLIISEYIRDYLSLDQIIFIPAGQPPHKLNKIIGSPNHRFNMADLAIKDNEKFTISDMEIRNKETSYTYPTVKKIIDENKGSDYYFIIGADSLFSLDKWHNFSELTKIIKFALWERRGYYKDDIMNRIKYLKKEYGTSISYIEGPIMEISSSYIRNRLKSKKSIKYLVPNSVLEYIEENNLYSGE